MVDRGCRRAVVLARGLGSRMRRSAEAPIDDEQARVADTGMKAMIPVGRPFLDYLLSALADSGIVRVILVIGPEHEVIRDYYTSRVVLSRLSVDFAVQDRPLGTADAVLAAEPSVGREPFIAVNSDNYYPASVLAAVRALPGSGLAAFDPEALVTLGNIEAGRVSAYAVLDLDDAAGPHPVLRRIVEKPDEGTWATLGRSAPVSMNCWRFGPTIFDAARSIRPSRRGEYEIADAVQYAIERMGERFLAVRVSAGVLDLSNRADIPQVARRLAGAEVRL
jgi:glucose-1-phosphate thymidylyltransferase